MKALQAGLVPLFVLPAACAWLEPLDTTSHTDPQIHGAGARDVDGRDLAVGPEIQGPAFQPATIEPLRETRDARPVSFAEGPAWVSDIALPDRPLVLHIDEAVATARVTGLDGHRVWFGATQKDADIEGGFGRTYRFFTGTNAPDPDIRHSGAVVRLTLPVENPSAHNLAIGERAGASSDLVWRVITPVERTAAFAVFEIIGAPNIYIRLTSASPRD